MGAGALAETLDCYEKFSCRAELSHDSRVDQARGEPERLANYSKQNAAPASEIPAGGVGVTSPTASCGVATATAGWGVTSSRRAVSRLAGITSESFPARREAEGGAGIAMEPGRGGGGCRSVAGGRPGGR